jgi:hypothetical protein
MKYIKSLFYMIVALIAMASTLNAQHIRSERATEIISPPILNSPANGSTGISLNPTLTWNASAGAISYELQVSFDSTFTTTTCDVSGLTVISKTILGLSLRTKYYWRVNARNAGGTSSWSAVWNFNTVNGLSWTQVSNGLRTTGTTSDFLTLAINSSGYIFAGSSGDGAYLSTDNGASWTGINSGLTNGNVLSLVFNSSGTLFAGMDGGGVCLSSDNGTTWTQAGMQGSPVSSLAVSSTDEIFATTNGEGIFLSTDNGTTWNLETLGLVSNNFFPLAINSSNYIFAGAVDGSYEGVYRSTNNGRAWTQVHNGMPNDNVNSLAINSSDYIFAGTNSNGLYLSTNNGTSWSPVNSGLTYNSVWPLAIHSSGYMFAGTDGGGVYLSANNGTSWTQENNGLTEDGLTENVVASLAFSPSGYIFAGTYGGGIYRASISFLYAPPLTPMLATPLNAANKLPLNPTLSWNASPGASHYELQVSVDSTFATTTRDSIGLTNTAQSVSGLLRQTRYYWRVNANNPGGTSSWSPVWSFTTCPFDLISVKDVPFDQGGKVELIWQASPLDTNVNTLPYYSIWRALPEVSQQHHILKKSQSTLKVQSTNKKIKLMKTADGSFAWDWLANQPAHRDSLYSYIASTLYDSMPGTNGIEYFMVSAQTSDLNVFYDSNIDSGYSVDNLPPLAPDSLTASVFSGKVVLNWRRNLEPDLMYYIVYRTDSSNADQRKIIPYDTTTDIVYTDTHPLAGKAANYMIRAEDIHGNLSSFSNEVSIVVTSVESASAQIPAKYELRQNFPNPVNPTTTISFDIPTRSIVSLKIFDMLGREISTLVSGEMEAGAYTRQWNAANMASGVYFYRLQAGTYTETKKLLLLK